METIRIDWMCAIGCKPDPSIEGPVIVNAFCNFYTQVSYPGDLIIKTYIGKVGRTSVDVYNLMSVASNPNELCAAGGTTLVWVNFKTKRPAPWPEPFQKHLGLA